MLFQAPNLLQWPQETLFYFKTWPFTRSPGLAKDSEVMPGLEGQRAHRDDLPWGCWWWRLHALAGLAPCSWAWDLKLQTRPLALSLAAQLLLHPLRGPRFSAQRPSGGTVGPMSKSKSSSAGFLGEAATPTSP